jgi:hypothetical protein
MIATAFSVVARQSRKTGAAWTAAALKRGSIGSSGLW